MGATSVCVRCAAAIAPEDPACPHCGAEAPRPAGSPSAPDSPPDLPSRYDVKLLLGWGGMGRVFLCRDTTLDVDVAVKVLRPDIASDERKVKRIESEAKVAARLRGLPGILGLYGFEGHGATRYIVMEYAAGGSVFQRVRDQGKLPESGCRRIGAEVAEALAAAHERGVLHRDIKPANILLDISGKSKVADFGLAHVVPQAYGEASRAPREGTPVYMPPEAFGEGGVDGRSDLYSLGALLYEMATGTPPFRGSVREIAAAKSARGAEPPDPRALQPKLTPEFAAVVRRLMEPDPARRFPDAASAAAALRATVEVAKEAPAPPPVPNPVAPRGRGAPDVAVPVLQPVRGRSKFPWAPLLGVAAVGGLLAAVVIWGKDGNRAPPPGPGPAAAPVVAGAPKERDDVLVVVTRPAGAFITIDGRNVGKTVGEEGLRVPGLAPDVPHVVSAALLDHEPDEERNVVLKKGKPRGPVLLKLVAKTGIPELEGGKKGATATFRREGHVARQTAFRDDGTLPPEAMPAGEYEVEVLAKGWRPWKRTIRIVPGANARLRIEFDPMDGILNADSTPTGAKVLVDGKEVGKTPLREHPLKAGMHDVSFVHEEASPVSREVEIKAEERTDLGVVALPPFATLDLAALPSEVTLVVEGAAVGAVLRRSAGPVMLTFRKLDCANQSIQVTLVSGPNPLPPLKEWEPAPGRLDFTGLGKSADLVLANDEFVRQPWYVQPVPSGFVHLVYAKAGAAPVSLRLAVKPGETVKVPEPVFGGRDPVSPPAAFRGLEGPINVGVEWLIRHQSGDGSWDAAGFKAQCADANVPCPGPGNGYFDSGLTGLSVLAILGRRAVDGDCDGLAALRGLDWLLQHQERNGESVGSYGGVGGHSVYNHAIATLAVIEGYRATGSPALWHSAQSAITFIESRRNPGFGWRYVTKTRDNDTSVTNWMVQALRAGRDAGMRVDGACFAGALAWVDAVTDEGGRVGYTEPGNGPARPEALMKKFPMEKSEAMTAAGTLIRLACGRPASDPSVQKGLALCLKIPPEWSVGGGSIDFYYWYLGTRAVFEAAPVEVPVAGTGDSRLFWVSRLERALGKNQRLDRVGCAFGSWDPVDPWGEDGGRIYATAINVLSLEAPFRRTPAFTDRPEATTLTAASDPPGALIWLDGHFAGSTPLAKVPIAAGKYALRLSHPERGDVETELEVLPFKDNTLASVALPPGAILDLGDLPRDATAVVYGREMRGKAPIRPGEVKGFLVRPGHAPQPFRVEAKTGEPAKPVAGPWKPAPDWPRALLPGLPPPPAAELEGLALPADVTVHEGRIWHNKDRAEMVLVPALAGAAGAPQSPALLVDRHEVTVAQLQLYCKAIGARMPDQPKGSTPRHPAVNLNREWAEAYANWAGRRLLTPEEWRRTAIGRVVDGSTSPWPYPWGTWDSVRARNVIGAEDGAEGAAPVGSYPLGMSPCGVLDLVGNVAERVAGGYVTGASFETHRRETYTFLAVGTAEPDIGLRCALDLPAPKPATPPAAKPPR
jgi:hypothetical protein